MFNVSLTWLLVVKQETGSSPSFKLFRIHWPYVVTWGDFRSQQVCGSHMLKLAALWVILGTERFPPRNPVPHSATH